MRIACFSGSHSGIRISEALYGLFDGIGIAQRIEPGTVDNASSNKVAADELARIVARVTGNSLDDSESVGCACHVANLAARAFLEFNGEALFFIRVTLIYG